MNFLLHNSTKGNFCCTTLRKEISVDLKVIFCGTLSLSYANIHLIKTRCFTLMSTLRSLHVKNGLITLSHFPFPGVKISRWTMGWSWSAWGWGTWNKARGKLLVLICLVVLPRGRLFTGFPPPLHAPPPLPQPARELYAGWGWGGGGGEYKGLRVEERSFTHRLAARSTTPHYTPWRPWWDIYHTIIGSKYQDNYF